MAQQLDENSGTWRLLDKLLAERLAFLQVKLEARSTATDTDYVRGQIAMLREVKALPEQLKREAAQERQQQPVDYENN